MDELDELEEATWPLGHRRESWDAAGITPVVSIVELQIPLRTPHHVSVLPSLSKCSLFCMVCKFHLRIWLIIDILVVLRDAIFDP